MSGARTIDADGRLVGDVRRVLRAGERPAAGPGDVPSLPAFLDVAEGRRAGSAVWLAPGDEPAQLAGHIDALTLIAVDFPSFKDGRGYSTAALLRGRYGFGGDLRAVGDVLVDQLFYLRRVGFSSFALRADQDPAAAAAALSTFSDVYQGSVDQPLPYFRRRAALAGGTE